MHEEDSETAAVGAAGRTLPATASEAAELPRRIRAWGAELGFAAIGISGIDLAAAAPALLRWLQLGRHGEMDYMAKHAPLRLAPQELLPGVRTVISARLPYYPPAADAETVLADDRLGYVSRYALGRDYHRTVRGRLQKLATRLQEAAA
ncbi:MAG TPA: tRNA epoxyqueuosine(34) reductase QueG, partial [Candidatus Accumulibacter sp.]|nr:tRNA epoxyqueuosine(34) reductase QueG [Accumulibacter sp.]